MGRLRVCWVFWAGLMRQVGYGAVGYLAREPILEQVGQLKMQAVPSLVFCHIVSDILGDFG